MNFSKASLAWREMTNCTRVQLPLNSFRIMGLVDTRSKFGGERPIEGASCYVAAEKHEGVHKENWLPINRRDEDMDIVLRAYVADLKKMKTWTAPKAETLKKQYAMWTVTSVN